MEKRFEIINDKLQTIAKAFANGLRRANSTVASSMPSKFNEGAKHPQRIETRHRRQQSLGAKLGIKEYGSLHSQSAKRII